MRIPVAREGVPTIDDDGRFIEPGSLTWREAVPVTVLLAVDEGYSQSQAIGIASEFQREDDGTITAELSHPVVGLAPQIEIDNLECQLDRSLDRSLDQTHITAGRICAVMLGSHPCWNDLVIGATT